MKKRKKSSDIKQVIRGLEKILKHGHYGKLPVQPVRKCPGHAGYDCSNPRRKLHPCPYKEDIYGDIGTLCACCIDCENSCARDI